jgi:hypothetical protein
MSKCDMTVLNLKHRIWWLGFILGFISGVPYLVMPIEFLTFPGYILPLAIIIQFFSATGISFYLPQEARRDAIAVAIGLPAAVICKIIIDSTQDSSSHNLFPFEIIFSLVISIPSTFLGVKVGLFARSVYTDFSGRGPEKI